MLEKNLNTENKSENLYYYQQLIQRYGLDESPEMTAKIIQEARDFRCFRRNHMPFFWKDIAKELGISRSTMSNIIAGNKFPSKKTMDKLIAYFGLRV